VSKPVQTTDPTQGGEATYDFVISDAGTYMIAAVVNCPDGGSNSFFVNIDGEPTNSMIWDVSPTSGFETRAVMWDPSQSAQTWDLSAGTHRLYVRGREANSKLQLITIQHPIPAPTNFRVVVGP